MTGVEYQKKAMRTASELTRGALIMNGVMGLCGEAGECIDLVKKSSFQGHDLDEGKLIDELGDVLWYCAILAEGIGTTIDAVMEHNIAKLKKRYPDGFDADKSVHRTEREEEDDGR